MKKNKLMVLASAALATITGGAVSALTPGQGGVVTDTDYITVTGIKSANDTFKACKIVDVVYDSANNTVTYALTSAFTTWQSSLASGDEFYPTGNPGFGIEQYLAMSNGTASGSPITGNNQIDRLAARLASDSTFMNSCAQMGTPTASGDTYTSTLQRPYGGYLIVPDAGSGTTMSSAYGAMIANIGVKEQNGSYVADTTYATLAAKASEPGTIVKTSKKDGVATTSFAEDEVFDYEIVATAPSYPTNATNTKFGVTDTMEAGLTFNAYGNITVGNTTYTVDTTDTSCHTGAAGCIKNGNTVVGYVVESNSGQTREFVFNNIITLGSPVTIKYSASLDSDATLGYKTGANSVNENAASIEVPKNFYDTNSDWEISNPSTVTVYTYGIRIVKEDATDSTKKLQHAKFNICFATDTNCSNPVNGNTPLETDASGEIEYVSVAAGSYYLKEVVAPTGYKLAADTTAQLVGGSEGNDGYFEYTIGDPKAAFALPFTGGRGVVVYAILGITTVAIASAYYIRKKQQQA